MIDALLFAVRNALFQNGYDAHTCDVRANGQPPPSCGDIFVAIHQGAVASTMDNALDEYFDFSVTLTRRVSIPLDRLGDQLLARHLSGSPGLRQKPSMNERASFLKNFLHMNWNVLQDANDLLLAYTTQGATVYGFAEPARYRTMEEPHFEDGSWFGAEPDAEQVGLVIPIHFGECRRLQALEVFE